MFRVSSILRKPIAAIDRLVVCCVFDCQRTNKSTDKSYRMSKGRINRSGDAKGEMIPVVFGMTKKGTSKSAYTSTLFIVVLSLLGSVIPVPVLSSSAAAGPSPNTRKLVQIASPLQSLTIWDDDVKNDEKSIPTLRQLFLEKFRLGLLAEKQSRDELVRTNQLQSTAVLDGTIDPNSPNWINTVLYKEQKQIYDNEKFIESAYDNAIDKASKEYKQQQIQSRLRRIQKRKSLSKNQRQKYQFVGVINNKKIGKVKSTDKEGQHVQNQQQPITWYAREKPIDSTWTVRLVHVNRRSIIKDLFDNGKIDIFASYKNLGPSTSSSTTATASTSSENQVSSTSSTSLQPKVVAEYSVRKKTWKYVNITWIYVF
jgi:hypothetical protein